jgi:hypothetical protein
MGTRDTFYGRTPTPAKAGNILGIFTASPTKKVQFSNGKVLQLNRAARRKLGIRSTHG